MNQLFYDILDEELDFVSDFKSTSYSEEDLKVISAEGKILTEGEIVYLGVESFTVGYCELYCDTLNKEYRCLVTVYDINGDSCYYVVYDDNLIIGKMVMLQTGFSITRDSFRTIVVY